MLLVEISADGRVSASYELGLENGQVMVWE